MAANAWEFFNAFKESIGDATIDLDGHTFVMLLVGSGYTFDATDAVVADISSELSGNGYARVTLTNVTWTRSGGTATFDCDPAVFTASGGSIVARRAIIIDDTAAGDPLVCSALLDNTPADVTATDGNTLTIAPHASGVFTLA